MRNSVIRKLALNIAIFQLFLIPVASNAENKSTNYSLQPRIIEKVKGNYKRKDTITKEYSDISIFDNENIETSQYGANQMDFRYKADELLKDPLIWEEIQKYFPIENFNDKEDANFFYKHYLDLVCLNGCGHTAAANFVFNLFIGHEDEFYNCFKFPMYKVSSKKLDFNYEIFILKFFNYTIFEKKEDPMEGYRLITESFAHTYTEYLLNKFMNNNKPPKLNNYDYTKWTDKDWEKYNALEKDYNDKLKELAEQYKKAKDINHNLGIETNGQYGNLQAFLGDNHIKIDQAAKWDTNEINDGDILISRSFDLNEIDENGNIINNENIGLHFVYVVEITDDKIIVSSYGRKYLFENKDPSGVDKIVLKLSK